MQLASEVFDKTPLIVAGAGALIVNSLNLLELKNIPAEKRPNLRDFWYWLPVLFWPSAAAFLAWVYVKSGYDLKPMLSLQVGASAPLIVRALAASVPRTLDIPPGA